NSRFKLSETLRALALSRTATRSWRGRMGRRSMLPVKKAPAFSPAPPVVESKHGAETRRDASGCKAETIPTLACIAGRRNTYTRLAWPRTVRGGAYQPTQSQVCSWRAKQDGVHRALRMMEGGFA